MSKVRSLGKALAPAALALLSACEPDIGNDTIETQAMEFDPGATPAKVPDPTFLLINPRTGKIDLSLGRIMVPPSCEGLPTAFLASCEFGQYLQSLDGFPPSSAAHAQATAALAPATLGPTNVVVMNGAQPVPETDRVVTFDDATKTLTVAPKRSWPVGSQIRIGVRGYEPGVRTTDGKQVLASPVFALVKREGAGEVMEKKPAWLLTCGAMTATDIPKRCTYLELVAQGLTPTEAMRGSLLSLEQVRQAFLFGTRTWDLLQAGGLPKAETALAWGFPVHSASVIELDPKAGLVPMVTGGDTIRLAVNGSVKADTLKAAALGTPGTVALLDLTTLRAGGLGQPTTTVGFEAGAITIRTSVPLAAGHTYAIAVSRAVTNAAGVGLVPPPISVFLTASGPLSIGGKSTINSLADADAALLEPNRQLLAPALPAVKEIAGISRTDLAYFFAFTL